MALRAVQFNIEKTKSIPFKNKEQAPYLDAKGAIDTSGKVKPLPGQGYLIHDNLWGSIKYFFKDIGYDMKAVKDGLKGTANDHQMGRLNDVGLELGGIGIATYLASKTTNPKARLMEYIGLGTFLTAMNIYPKLAINKPAELVHGFEIDKEYVDDQGRKKSVFQDSNYIPYDLYTGEIADEDLDIIGDRMGISRTVVNRHDLIKEQMRKIATQNNTLWMLTAGVATPAMTGLLCCGLENYLVAPAIEKARTAKYDKLIDDMLAKTANMSVERAELNSTKLSEEVLAYLKNYSGKEFPKESFDKLLSMLAGDLESEVQLSIRADLTKMLSNAAKGTSAVVLDEAGIESIVKNAQKSIKGNGLDAQFVKEVLMPTKDDIIQAIKVVLPDADLKNGVTTEVSNVDKIKEELTKVLNKRMSAAGVDMASERGLYLSTQRKNIVQNISKDIKASKSTLLTDNIVEQIVDFAKILGEFKENKEQLYKCRAFKTEYAPETTIARAYEKFERVLFKELGIEYKDFKKMRESSEYTKKILDERFTALCKDEAKYKQTLEKLAKVISDMEVSLNGTDTTKSKLADLITAIENNYNKAAKRLANLNKEAFSTTIDMLVKENVDTLGNSVTSREALFDFLDGIKGESGINYKDSIDVFKKRSKGVGSAKNLEITRLLERYQGSKNSFNRILHTLELYKRTLDPEAFARTMSRKDAEYVNTIINMGKEILLSANASNHTLKFNFVNNPSFYKDFMNSVWAIEAGRDWELKQKGYVTDAAKEVFGTEANTAKANLLERFQYYLARLRALSGNNTTDFPKPEHILRDKVLDKFSQAEKTNLSMFNLIGQSPVDMAQGAANKRYGTGKWARIIGGITAGVFSVAILTQFAFGRISNPQNIKYEEQVNDENE